MLNEELVSENLLWPLWRCITDDFKTKYLKEIWDIFENAIKSASYTDCLKVFLENFKRRIPVDLQAQYSKDIMSIIELNEDEKILNWLRTESTYMVMIVRLKNQDRKESFKFERE